jgi:hypothetical protein
VISDKGKWMGKALSTPLQVMHWAIDRLYKGDTESAASAFFDVSEKSRKRILQSVLDEKEYETAKDVAYVLQSATLYYLTRAFEKQQKGDNVSFLAYLSWASGINAVLYAIMLPVVRRCASKFKNQDEIGAFEALQSSVEQKLNEMTVQATATLSGRKKEESFQRADESIVKMLSLVRTINPDIRDLSVQLGKKFPAGDFKQARRIFEFVRDEIQYIHDPLGVEEIQFPQKTIRLGSGDCDDKALLLVSLLMAIGFETCLFVADVDNDGLPDHVYAGVYIPDAPDHYKPFPQKVLCDGKNFRDWVPLDPTYEDSEFGLIPLIDLGIFKYMPIPPAGEAQESSNRA